MRKEEFWIFIIDSLQNIKKLKVLHLATTSLISVVLFVVMVFFSSSTSLFLFQYVSGDENTQLSLTDSKIGLSDGENQNVTDLKQKNTPQNSWESIESDISSTKAENSAWEKILGIYSADTETEGYSKPTENETVSDENKKDPTDTTPSLADIDPSNRQEAKANEISLPFLGLPWQIQSIFVVLFGFIFYQTFITTGHLLGKKYQDTFDFYPTTQGKFSEWILQSAPLLGLIGTLVSMLLSINFLDGGQTGLLDGLLDNFINALNTTVFGGLVYIFNFFMLSVKVSSNGET